MYFQEISTQIGVRNVESRISHRLTPIDAKRGSESRESRIQGMSTVRSCSPATAAARSTSGRPSDDDERGTTDRPCSAEIRGLLAANERGIVQQAARNPASGSDRCIEGQDDSLDASRLICGNRQCDDRQHGTEPEPRQHSCGCCPIASAGPPRRCRLRDCCRSRSPMPSIRPASSTLPEHPARSADQRFHHRGVVDLVHEVLVVDQGGVDRPLKPDAKLNRQSRALPHTARMPGRIPSQSRGDRP